MNRYKLWKILNWNIRGINAHEKHLALFNKIEESGCAILCLQETKREHFDLEYIKKFCPRRFTKFAFLPCVGASSGLLVVWNEVVVSGETLFQNEFSISIKEFCKLSDDQWYLSNIYGPCHAEKREEFLDWFSNIDMPDENDWIIMGDLNFMRSPEDRNKPGGDINDMLLFNAAISNLGLIELPIKGRRFTWSNMQQDPLLEKLDWFFTSESWTISYPATSVISLAKPISDHVPCLIEIGTKILRANVFKFENYWLQHNTFKQTVQNAWSIPVGQIDCAKKVNAKLKNVRRALKLWSKSLFCLKSLITQVNDVILLLDLFQELRPLSLWENNLRDILKDHLLGLLKNQNTY